MYNIIIDGEIVSTVILPCYVKYNDVVESFETCDEPEAEAVLVNVEKQEETDSFYADLENKTIRHEGFPIARIEKVES